MKDVPLHCDGILIKLLPRPAEHLLEVARGIAERPTITALDEAIGWYHLRAPALAKLPPSEGFRLAHALLNVPTVLAAEPNLVGEWVPQERLEELAEAAAGKPEEGHWTWPMEHIEAREARDLFGVRGRGVRVASLDTGATQHPELVAGTRVRFDLGYNFEEDRPDPTEPLNTIGSGHGTGTAAFVVGLEGRQMPGEGVEFVEGVAPDAELVPIRVDKDVWFLNAANDVRGIKHAMDQGCHAITISRGGSNARSLRDAVKSAADAGVIITAAASNCNVGCGVWSPGIYPEVVCVAGSTFERKPWTDSSRGSVVAISAPAASVYRAETRRGKSGYHYGVSLGSGTSFATPQVAGAAALWLEHHGGSAALAQKLGGRRFIPTAFKYILRHHGYSAGVDWDPANYGPGILNCPRLLDAPLPNPPELAAQARADAAGREASPYVGAHQLFTSAQGPALDPRRAHLLALELEVIARSQPEVMRLLAAQIPLRHTRARPAAALAGVAALVRSLKGAGDAESKPLVSRELDVALAANR